MGGAGGCGYHGDGGAGGGEGDRGYHGDGDGAHPVPRLHSLRNPFPHFLWNLGVGVGGDVGGAGGCGYHGDCGGGIVDVVVVHD